MRARASTAAADPAADILDRVQSPAPVIDRLAERAERERRLPAELLAELHDRRLFRLLLPAPYDGEEVDPVSFFRIIEAVAKLDASTAWCLCQANGCAMIAAFLEPAVAQQIWGRDPAAVLAWGPGAKSRAARADGGFRLTGKWSFASGARHATWLGGHAVVTAADGTPARDGEGAAVIRTMLFPADLATMTDVWDVIGLRATGSDSYSISDLFVRHDHSVSRENPAERRHRTPLYQFPALSLYAIGFSATALGIARTMLDTFMDLAADKTPRLARQVLRDNGVIQADTARAEARLGAARAFVVSEVADIWASVIARGRLTVAERMRIRLAATYAIHEAKAAADTAYDLAGATAIFTAGRFERRFRDIHTVTQQLQGRRTHFETVGAFLLGHPPDLSVA